MDHLSSTTIGILYPGDMGSSLGKLLHDAGFRVVTALEGRSSRTHRLCRAAGLDVLASMGDVLSQSNVVISLVTPCAALQMAKQAAALTKDSPRELLYVDANSISPMTVSEIANALRHSHMDLIDASIHGTASQLHERGILYLSGLRAFDVAAHFEPLMRVKIVGAVPGQASALKMVLAGMSKGLVGLFIETMAFARQLELLNEALESCQTFYPGVMEAIARMLPTYPQHAGRRVEELQELEHTMLLNGLTPRVVKGVREVIADLAGLEWPKGRDPKQWTTAEIIEEVHRSEVPPPGACAPGGWRLARHSDEEFPGTAPTPSTAQRQPKLAKSAQ